MNLKNHLKDNRRHNIVTASAAWGAIYERKKLWRQKTLREAPFKGNIMTEWGNNYEEVALQAFEKHMGEICENGNKLLVHPDFPLGASSDGFLNGMPIEIKCPFTQKIYPTKAIDFLKYVSDDKEPPRYKRKPKFNFNKGK